MERRLCIGDRVVGTPTFFYPESPWMNKQDNELAGVRGVVVEDEYLPGSKTQFVTVKRDDNGALELGTFPTRWRVVGAHLGDYDLEYDVDQAVEIAYNEGMSVGWGEADIKRGRHAGDFLPAVRS